MLTLCIPGWRLSFWLDVTLRKKIKILTSKISTLIMIMVHDWYGFMMLLWIHVDALDPWRCFGSIIMTHMWLKFGFTLWYGCMDDTYFHKMMIHLEHDYGLHLWFWYTLKVHLFIVYISYVFNILTCFNCDFVIKEYIGYIYYYRYQNISTCLFFSAVPVHLVGGVVVNKNKKNIEWIIVVVTIPKSLS